MFCFLLFEFRSLRSIRTIGHLDPSQGQNEGRRTTRRKTSKRLVVYMLLGPNITKELPWRSVSMCARVGPDAIILCSTVPRHVLLLRPGLTSSPSPLPRYTSLGSVDNTLPNPALQETTSGGSVTYRPAYELEDVTRERDGRIQRRS